MRTTRLTQKTWMTLLLALITAWFLQESIGLSRVASIVPRVILSLTLLLLIIQLLLDIKSSGQPSPPETEAADQAGTGIPPTRRSPTWLVILWISVLPLTVWLFGVVAGIAVFCLVFMKWYALESWKISLAFALSLGFLMQLIFTFIFKITLYGGVITGVLA